MKVMSKEKGLQEFIGFGRTIVLHENEIDNGEKIEIRFILGRLNPLGRSLFSLSDL